MDWAQDVLALIRAEGRPVTLRRAGTPPLSATVTGVVRGAAPHGLVGSIDQMERTVRIAVADPGLVGWPVPPAPADQVVIDGRAARVAAVDSRAAGGEVVVWGLTVRG